MGEEYYLYDAFKKYKGFTAVVLKNEPPKDLDEALEMAENKLRGDLEEGYIYAPYIPVTFSNFDDISGNA
jgi:hypothetical protein